MESQKLSIIIIKYNPHSDQRKFHKNIYEVKFRAIFAGAGGGTIFAGVFEAII
jgi:hypothetical protein